MVILLRSLHSLLFLLANSTYKLTNRVNSDINKTFANLVIILKLLTQSKLETQFEVRLPPEVVEKC